MNMKQFAVGPSALLLSLFLAGCADSIDAVDEQDVGTVAQESHSWGGYHWARTSNPFTVTLLDSVDSNWDSVLATTSSDWTQSTVLNTTIVPGSANPKTCKATSGQVQVCNASYGNTGWLGIASIWLSSGHISQGTVKLNDTYFNTATYNTTAWRNLVSCQEVGHTFGLAHQDENFDNSNLGTCMDYTNNPSTNQHPNAHDYDELQTIYGHVDNFTTVGAALPPSPSPALSGDAEAEWGTLVDAHGPMATYYREFGEGHAVITEVFWAPL
jgi:hypothetical protein